MGSSKKILLINFVIIIVFPWVITACYFEESRSSIPVPIDQYSINPSSILESISRGEKNIFIPMETPLATQEFQYNPVKWKQEDYLIITNSLHEVVWNESLTNWKLNSVVFNMDCDEISYGLQYARFIFFKATNDANGGYRIAHNLTVESYNGLVYAWADKYSPLVMTWDEVDLSELRISSDEALRIAELNGGSKVRESANNNCSISVSFNTSEPSKGIWLVSYYTEEGNFNIQIDPITGKHK